MMMNNEVNVMHYIFHGLEKDPYLKRIYSQLISRYTKASFTSSETIESEPSFSVRDALQFADLLSKSVDPEMAEFHKSIAQEMVVMLNAIYPDDRMVNATARRVLINLGNFPGIGVKEEITFAQADFLDQVFEDYNKALLAIPEAEGKVFSTEQKAIFDNLSSRVFSFSGPTSMGKSFLIRHYIKGKIADDDKENFAIIVPTKALINEVSQTMSEEIRPYLQDKDYRAVTSANSLAVEEKHNFIFVLTPERLLYLLMSRPDITIGFAFIDEAQNINSLDGRSGFYFKTISILAEHPETKIIFASPYSPNPDVYLKAMPKGEQDAKHLVVSRSPVSQFKFFVNLRNLKFFSYNELTQKMQFESAVTNGTTLTDLILKVSDPRVPESKSSLIYCNSKDKALTYSKNFVDKLSVPLHDPDLNEFSKEIAEEISSSFCLARFVKYGVGLHLGYLPPTIRKKMELLFQSHKLKVIFCTSTLLEGVNLPADNIFLASDYKYNHVLNGLEFRNLSGRAGRISHSLNGNVIGVLQPDSKKETEQQFERLYKSKPEEQQLSLEKALTPDICHRIVNRFLEWSSNVDYSDLSLDYEEEDLLRKTGNILLGDIVNGRRTYVVALVEERGNLDGEKKEKIKAKFEAKRKNISDDININLDQSIRLEETIKSGLEYPRFVDSTGIGYDPDSFEKTSDFLEKLSEVYQWAKYDPKLVWGKNLQGYYAPLLVKWMKGIGLPYIISDSMKRTKTLRINPKQVISFDIYDEEHVNRLIANILDDIQSAILFSFSNYFLKFSSECKRQHGPDSLNDNDWYLFVEFGSMN